MTKTRYLSKEHGNLVSRAVRLRSNLLALTNKQQPHNGPALIAYHGFVKGLHFGWDERGVDGVRAACFDLAADLANVAGAYDLLVEAKDIAAGRAARSKLWWAA